MGRALLVIDVQNEDFAGTLSYTHSVRRLGQILRGTDAAACRIPTAVV